MSWLTKLFGGGSGSKLDNPAPGKPVTSDEIRQLVAEYGILMERHASFGVAVSDEDTLPAPKMRLEKVLRAEVAMSVNESQVNVLAPALVTLAQYQPQVGDVSVTLLPQIPDLSALSNPADLKPLARSFTAHSESSRYESFRSQVDGDERRLKAVVEEARAKWQSQVSRGAR